MTSLNNYINESLLSNWETQVKDTSVSLNKQWLEEHCKGDYKIHILKDGTAKVSSGTLIIKNLEDSELPITFTKFEGNLTITSCPNITSLEGWFGPQCVAIGGSLNICNCPKFNSLEGIPPIIEGEFNITGNKSFRSLGDFKFHVGKGSHFFKNGKKFQKDELESIFNSHKNIYCSCLEDTNVICESSYVNESLNEPHLLLLAKKLHNIDKNNKYHDFTFVALFGKESVAWDEIDSSNVKIYDSFDPKGLTAVRKIISSGIQGIVILTDRNGEYTYCINSRKHLYDLTNQSVSNPSTTEIMLTIKKSEEIIVINIPEELNTYDKIRQRFEDKKNIVVQGDPGYYKKVANENMKRYKLIIAKNKVNKPGESQKIIDAVQKCLDRTMTATKNITADPAYHANDMIILDDLQRIIYSKSNIRYHYSTSLLQDFNSYIYYYNSLKASQYSPQYTYDKLERLKEACEQKLKKCDELLKKLNA